VRFIQDLSPETQHILRRLYKHSQHHRVRQRAHCILMSFHGMTTNDLMKMFAVGRLTIYHWFNAWETRHLAGLYDHKGRGRPPKLTPEEQEKVHQYIEQHPKDIKKVVHLLEQETSKCVSTKTINRLLKKTDYAWKRIKKSPEKQPDPQQYERSKALIARLQAREATGECDLWYFDGSGFCLTPYIPYAWQPRGSVITVPTAMHNRRLNVLGFLTRYQSFFPYVIEGCVDTAVVIECFDQFSQHLHKKAYVFLDNASIHKSQAFIRHIPQWVKRGLIIKYLPPYSPELNLIEILWRCMKYHWLPFSAYMSFQCLRQAIEDILVRFGTEYTIAFETI
jgi:transposase